MDERAARGRKLIIPPRRAARVLDNRAVTNGPSLRAPVRAPSRRRARANLVRRTALIVVLVALVAAGVTVAYARSHRAPYGVGAVGPHLQLQRYTDTRSAQAAVDRFVGPDRLTVPEHRAGTTLVVGTLTFSVPHDARAVDQHVLFVLDALGAPVQDIWGVAPTEDAVVTGWDSRYGDLAGRYSWLSRLRPVQVGDQEWMDPGSALGWRATTPGPVTFVALVPDVGTVAQREDVTVALALLGNDRMHWAAKVTP